MNPTITIAPKGPGFAVSIPIEAVRLKTEALEAAKIVTQVTTGDEQKTAIAVVARLKSLSNGVEQARVEVKAPYLAAGKAIDAKAKEYAKELDEKASVIERMIGSFQQVERAKAEAERIRQERAKAEAEDAANRERLRVEQAARESAAAEERRVEAERARAQAELDAAEAVGKKAKAAAAAELANAEQAAKAAEAEAKAAEQASLQAEIDASEAEETANDANAIVYTPEPPRATGASIRDVVDFEVTDIDAFAEWDRQRRVGKGALRSFVKMEVKRQDFKDFIAIMPEAALAEIPGVTITRSTKAAVRSSATDFSNIPHFPGELPQ